MAAFTDRQTNICLRAPDDFLSGLLCISFAAEYRRREGDLDTFVSTIKEMGMDRLVEIQQASYDRYLER